ncbi:hypothetical protein [Marinoscillum sp. 108]|uniref:hypothetical protein n=1 Tax=Marinoscillum sp. 108 TaxID=2653151 RepID=UPI0012EFDD5C|nr:hypothetical protein [Marinoscillum sp. 108]VXD10881.1 hypothetical protein MARINOS108_10293 [Marinoscillum sp. 108]
MKYFLKPSVIGILFVALFFGNCSEPKKKQETTKPVVKTEPEPAGLTDEQKTFIKERFQQYAEVKAKFDKTKKSDGVQIGELNRSLRELGEFPSWFSKNTPEIRYLKLVKSFVTDMGNALATRNDQLLEIARNDYDKYSKDLQNMLE